MGLNDRLGLGKLPGEVVGARPDRRRSSRVPVPNSEVYYSTPLLPLLMRAPKGERCLLVNISGGGLQFISNQYLEPGKKISLLVIVPAFLGHMTFRARVVWSQKIPDKKVYRTGVEFLKMDRESQTKLNNLRKDVSLRSSSKKPRPPSAQA
jgi:c-di-GMP-binding flagellar brake protein YcgR